jgi:DMSO/TMAO reductase YedYZ molybdopterin-dependent catalytic subunit
MKLSLCLLLAALSSPSLAQPNPSDLNPPILAISGEVDHPYQLTAADLQAMPRAKIQARDHDGQMKTFEGVSLWELVTRAKPRLGDKPKGATAHGSLVVKASDQYQAVFALAEIDPAFTDNQIILADHCDGKPLPDSQGPFQVIVPADKIRARWVRQVISLEVIVPGQGVK